MKKIIVNLKERAYPIVIGSALSGVGKAMAAVGLHGKVLLVTNTTVKRLYAKTVEASLKAAGFTVEIFALADGEQYKNLAAVAAIYGAALKAGLDRRSTIVALGGGVVGDVAGFAAATYLRGVAFVQIPTTLLAMVDSSVGGKTGVDLKEGKNLAGAFYQPKLVWIDTAVLKTLPMRQMCNGMAEVIKYGVIADKKLFAQLEKQPRPAGAVLDGIVSSCCQIKAAVVEEDEFETKGLREILNFGHTYGHAIESASGYRLLHGEAVAIGMVTAAKIAVLMGQFSAHDLARLETVIKQAGLPVVTQTRYAQTKIEQIMLKDKKTRDGQYRFVLPYTIGGVRAGIMVPASILREVLL